MPIGTVMSALARAREKLQHTLTQTVSAKSQEASREL
jgi:DNA-directed RNA polymerase specialized sigma24 family protein